MSAARSWTLVGTASLVSGKTERPAVRGGPKLAKGERVRVVPLDDVLEALREHAKKLRKYPEHFHDVPSWMAAADFLEARFSSSEGEGGRD